MLLGTLYSLGYVEGVFVVIPKATLPMVVGFLLGICLLTPVCGNMGLVSLSWKPSDNGGGGHFSLVWTCLLACFILPCFEKDLLAI